MVYPFSSHNYDLRYWLAAAAIDPVNDVNLVVVPPPLIAESLKAGQIDGFCVGEPWNSVAVADGSGVIIATKPELWHASPEKVLALRADFSDAHHDVVLKLIRAVSAACVWLDDLGNRRAAAEILARPEYVGLSQHILLRSLVDQLVRGAGFTGEHTRDVLVFNKGNANFPWVSHAIWILTQMIRWGQVREPFDIAGVARRVYRPALYRSAVAATGQDVPKEDEKIEGGGAFFGCETFDPKEPLAYIDRLATKDKSVDLTMFGQPTL